MFNMYCIKFFSGRLRTLFISSTLDYYQYQYTVLCGCPTQPSCCKACYYHTQSVLLFDQHSTAPVPLHYSIPKPARDTRNSTACPTPSWQCLLLLSVCCERDLLYSLLHAWVVRADQQPQPQYYHCFRFRPHHCCTTQLTHNPQSCIIVYSSSST